MFPLSDALNHFKHLHQTPPSSSAGTTNNSTMLIKWDMSLNWTAAGVRRIETRHQKNWGRSMVAVVNRPMDVAWVFLRK